MKKSIVLTAIATGKVDSTVINKNQVAGNYNVDYSVSDLTAGIYFYTLTIDGASVTNKLQVVK